MPRLPWSALHADLHQTLRDRHLLYPQQKLLLAVSGGQDSLCLLGLFLHLQPRWSWQLGIIHCDHRWRSDSAANALAVQQFAETLKIPFYLQTAPEPPPNEAAARCWRYQVFQAVGLSQGYDAVLTGHTASDRAETLLYNLMRGSGADGLAALTWQRPLGDHLTLVRPLLKLTRQQTSEFCQSHDLPVWWDQTNDDRRYSRNRIRLDLLPYLTTTFNPKTEQHLAQTAELLQADVAYLEAQAQALRHQVQDDRRLQRPLLQQAPLALQRRVIRQFLQDYLPHPPTFEQIEKVVRLLQAPSRSQTDPFPGGAVVRVVENTLTLIQISG